ncbi:hypothetical protein ElyMa_005589000 [Elysia marginata]|uniref:Uncharacterized protein n=1 Tax=Elysia marginata TaxID=1093978 RepID=A0AAV4F5H6_9GAST|nr:hypothetical protein ElyMa_005589000 [Elysia marginata]
MQQRKRRWKEKAGDPWLPASSKRRNPRNVIIIIINSNFPLEHKQTATILGDQPAPKSSTCMKKEKGLEGEQPNPVKITNATETFEERNFTPGRRRKAGHLTGDAMGGDESRGEASSLTANLLTPKQPMRMVLT